MVTRKANKEPFGPRRPPVEEHAAEIFRAAEKGDKMAARDALAILTYLVWPGNVSPEGEPLPFPLYAREYLHKALHSMAYKKQSGDEAFNLTRKGPNHWTLLDRKLVCDLVDQVRARPGVTSIEQAVATALEAIAEHAASSSSRSIWRNFADRLPDERTVRGWYAASERP